MEEEPWDELMGPSPKDLQRMLRTKETTVQPSAVRREASSSAAPPANMFAQMPNMAVSSRWASAEEEEEPAVITPTRKSSSSLAIEDEASPEHHSFVRDEAMRILEYADESNFSVQRTATGGIQATHQGFANEKARVVPKALSGLSFKSSRRNEGRKFRDLDLLESNTQPHRVDLEYGDEDAVDVISMERRFASSRPQESQGTASTWSSRYSVDNTLLGISGGSISRSGLLKEERQAARNLFGGKKSTSVFGSRGFSFRKKNVFGKQGVTLPPPSRNLQTVWVDAPEDSPSNSPAKSWQEQLAQKRRQRRNYILIIVAAIGLVVALSASLHRRSQSASQFSEPSLDHRDISFYATSDTPLSSNEQENLRDYVSQLEFFGEADLFIHLGNTQDPDQTGCSVEAFQSTANILARSPFRTLVVPGIDDWRNCPDEDDGWENWWSVFQHFGGPEARRQTDQRENWAYEAGGVLFLGVHVVEGKKNEIDMVEQTVRNMRNIRWIQDAVLHFGSDVRAVVIFGNAKPQEGSNDLFWVELGEIVNESSDRPYLYVHGNGGQGGTEFYRIFDDVGHVYGIQVQKGGNAPPVRVRVSLDTQDLAQNPFSLS